MPKDGVVGIVVTEARMHVDAQGRVRSQQGSVAYERWLPLLEVFAELRIVARVEGIVGGSDGVLVEGPRVVVVALPNYRGWRQLVMRSAEVATRVWRLGTRRDVFVLRIPEVLSLVISMRAMLIGAPMLCMVVVDPRQLVEATLPGRLGQLGGTVLSVVTRQVVAKSSAVTYVTRKWLQCRYPARKGVPTLSRSNVVIPSGSFVTGARMPVSGTCDRVNLIYVGTIEKHKGVDFLVRVVSDLGRRGMDVHLDVVGTGKHTERVKELVERLDVHDRITMHGHIVDSTRIRSMLDRSAIFVSGSRSEGLSRAIVEAMARGLPVVATDAGGVSELIGGAYVKPQDDLDGFVSAVQCLCEEPRRYSEASMRNLDTARKIAADADPARLVAFLRAWLTGLQLGQ